MCSAIDLVRLARHFEQVKKTQCEDAAVCRGFLDQFMADWDCWKMADTFGIGIIISTSALPGWPIYEK